MSSALATAASMKLLTDDLASFFDPAENKGKGKYYASNKLKLKVTMCLLSQTCKL